jgi:glutamine amidotransferase
MIAIIDYRMGNVTSVANALRGLGAEVSVTNRTEDLERAERIVLPGVGAFGEGMRNLKALGLIPILEEQVLRKKKPFLGICVGMQVLANKGHEFGEHEGLGWIPGEVRRFEADLALPHVGWNDIQISRPSDVLKGMQSGADFYFVHSYHFVAENPSDVTATASYGQDFTAIVSRENIFGVQFHPEKSQKAGKVLLENFLKLS